VKAPSCRSFVVKIGSNVIAKDDGTLAEDVIQALVAQVAALVAQGIRVVLVTSGAVAAGRSLVELRQDAKAVVRRQVLAAAGQVSLMHTYARHFAPFGLVSAQVLATKEDFRDRQHYINMRNCLEALIGEGVVPLVNENDVVAVSELMFSDNDELAGLVAGMLSFDGLVLLTSVDGIYDAPPAEPGAKLIPVIDSEIGNWRGFLNDLEKGGRSTLGRGGMRTKCEIARKLAAMGTATYIASGRSPDALIRIAGGEPVGTLFPPTRRASNTKRRIAHTPPKVAAAVRLNAGACQALRAAHHATSLLPIGIVAVRGEFEKGDVIAICDARGRELGVGVAQYDAERARECMGKRGQRPLVHYNSLCLHPG
jgi:glutamate 5-kinase